MNSLIRYLTFRATYPTHFFEGLVYMSARLLLGALTFFASVAASPTHARPWLVVSFMIAMAGARAAQTVRSGANRREETKTRLFASDPKLPCEADLKQAAAVGSLCASLVPAVTLGSAISGAWVGVIGGWALAASVLAGLQSAFDVAWSAWIYPAWRRRYTAERDALRAVRASVEHAEKKPRTIVDVLLDYDAHPPLTDEQLEQAGSLGYVEEGEPEDAPTTLMTRDPAIVRAPTSDGFEYIRCNSLDYLLAEVDADTLPAGTRLYLNDDSPVVERGEGGWFVDWLDGTTGPVFLLSEGKERERFLAMAEGRET